MQAYGDAYHLVEKAQHVEPGAPFIIKNECGSHITVKPGPTFQVCYSTFTCDFRILITSEHFWDFAAERKGIPVIEFKEHCFRRRLMIKSFQG